MAGGRRSEPIHVCRQHWRSKMQLASVAYMCWVPWRSMMFTGAVYGRYGGCSARTVPWRRQSPADEGPDICNLQAGIAATDKACWWHPEGWFVRRRVGWTGGKTQCRTAQSLSCPCKRRRVGTHYLAQGECFSGFVEKQHHTHGPPLGGAVDMHRTHRVDGAHPVQTDLT